MHVGRLALRLTIGPLFVGHGTQKLLGWFGGSGLDGTAETFERIGMRPGRRHAQLAGAAETVGGVMVTIGALTPLAAALLTGVMTTAIRKVHASNGPWVSNGGFEYNAVLIAALAALVEQGPGRPSVDGALFPRMNGPALALAAVAAGAGGSFFNERLPVEPSSSPGPDQHPAASAHANGGQQQTSAGAAA